MLDQFFSQFSPQPHISVHTVEGSDHLQDPPVRIALHSKLYMASCIKSLLIGGLSEETGYHFVSFGIHQNFVGSSRFI